MLLKTEELKEILVDAGFSTGRFFIGGVECLDVELEDDFTPIQFAVQVVNGIQNPELRGAVAYALSGACTQDVAEGTIVYFPAFKFAKKEEIVAEPLAVGTQIAYVPDHARGDVRHPDCQYGFVTAYVDPIKSYFCRYWRRGKEGVELRTRAGSEMTYARHVIPFESTLQEAVERELTAILGGEE